MKEKIYVFIDPDGTHRNYLYVIVNSPTGIIYSSQCEGLSTTEKSIEGFIVPLDEEKYSSRFIEFFTKYNGNPPNNIDTKWEEGDLETLSLIISDIPIWQSDMDSSSRTFLKMDFDRINDLTEAWVPVKTPYGDGILIFKNSD